MIKKCRNKQEVPVVIRIPIVYDQNEDYHDTKPLTIGILVNYDKII